MNGFHNIFNNMSQGPQLRTHGSVEDMIRAMLGNNFITQEQPQEPAPVMEIQQFPIEQEPSIIQPPTPKDSGLSSKSTKPIEKYCDVCDKPESKCVCLELPIDQDEEEIDYQDEADLEIEIEDDEDDIPPFQKIVRSGKFKSKETGSSTKYQNTDGIGLKPKEKIPAKPISKHYPFYRDIDEVFECNVTIEGTMSTATVRLILNTDTWNLVFYGKIKRDGTCLIPIKKLSVLPSGTTGRATLEVVVDDVVFYPWENAFRVEESRKVQVQIKGKSSK